MPVRFHIPIAFQIAGWSLACRSASKLKQSSPTQSEIWQVDKVRLKVHAADRVYPGFLFTENLIRAGLVSSAESECTPDRHQEICRSKEDE
ncbi:unnamed protein product [Prunus armeniaca]